MIEHDISPAPWRVRFHNDGPIIGVRIMHGDNGTVCIMKNANGRKVQNARLVAAAPDMLEALENLENDDGKAMPPSAWKLVQGAIAKARGKE